MEDRDGKGTSVNCGSEVVTPRSGALDDVLPCASDILLLRRKFVLDFSVSRVSDCGPVGGEIVWGNISALTEVPGKALKSEARIGLP